MKLSYLVLSALLSAPAFAGQPSPIDGKWAGPVTQSESNNFLASGKTSGQAKLEIKNGQIKIEADCTAEYSDGFGKQVWKKSGSAHITPTATITGDSITFNETKNAVSQDTKNVGGSKGFNIGIVSIQNNSPKLQLIFSCPVAVQENEKWTYTLNGEVLNITADGGKTSINFTKQN